MFVLDNYEPIDFGSDCQAAPCAVQLSERVDELDRSLLAVVTAILVAKMDNANLVAYRCICIHCFQLFMCFPVSGLTPAEDGFSARSVSRFVNRSSLPIPNAQRAM